MKDIISPLELWNGYDGQLPLDINILCTKQESPYTIQHMYFSGETTSEGVTRVFGIVVANNNVVPTGRAILLIDNPHKPIDIAKLQFFADQGIIAMGIDYSGNDNVGKHTIYPHSISYANCNSQEDNNGSPRDTKWYHYAVSSMRAVTYLRQRQDVGELSVISVGSGSHVAMIVLGIDKRINNGMLLFGNLYQNRDGGTVTQQVDFASDDSQQLEELYQEQYQEQKWQVLCPQNYLPLIQVPIYVIATGNSQYTDIVSLSQNYSSTNEHSRLLIVPNGFDSVDNNVADGMMMWLNGTTVAEDIELHHSNIEGKLIVSVTTDIEQDKLELWYTANSDTQGKHWSKGTLVPTEIRGEYNAELPVHQCGNMLALVVAKDIVTISSELYTIEIDNEYKQCPTKAWIYRGGNEFSFVNFDREGIIAEQLTEQGGYLDIIGTEGRILGTFAIHDTAIDYQDCDSITFDICCNKEQQLVVRAVSDYGCQSIQYTATVLLVGDGRWQRVLLCKEDFRRLSDGHSMAKDTAVELFVLMAEERFIVNNICVV